MSFCFVFPDQWSLQWAQDYCCHHGWTKSCWTEVRFSLSDENDILFLNHTQVMAETGCWTFIALFPPHHCKILFEKGFKCELLYYEYEYILSFVSKLTYYKNMLYRVHIFVCFLIFFFHIGEIKCVQTEVFYPHSTSEHSYFSWSEQHFEENKNIIWFHTHTILYLLKRKECLRPRGTISRPLN